MQWPLVQRGRHRRRVTPMPWRWRPPSTCWPHASLRAWRCRPPLQPPRRRHRVGSPRCSAAQPTCWRWARIPLRRGRIPTCRSDGHGEALLRLARRSATSGAALAKGVADLADQSRHDAASAADASGPARLGADRGSARVVLSARLRVPGHRPDRGRAGRRRAAGGSGMTACELSDQPKERKHDDART